MQVRWTFSFRNIKHPILTFTLDFSLLLQAHLSVCEFNVVSCPNRCSVKLLRRELPEHLQHDCVKRKLHCDHCGDEFTGEAYEVRHMQFFIVVLLLSQVPLLILYHSKHSSMFNIFCSSLCSFRITRVFVQKRVCTVRINVGLVWCGDSWTSTLCPSVSNANCPADTAEKSSSMTLFRSVDYMLPSNIYVFILW